MGRRAKKAPVVTKKKVKLAKRFKCPFCANDDVVECKMEYKTMTGTLSCRLCGASYQMPIHSLSEPIDVFSEWLDDCEHAQHNQGGVQSPAQPIQQSTSVKTNNNSNNDKKNQSDNKKKEVLDDEDDDDIIDDDDDDDDDDDEDDDRGRSRQPLPQKKKLPMSNNNNKKNNSKGRSIDIGSEDSEDDDEYD